MMQISNSCKLWLALISTVAAILMIGLTKARTGQGIVPLEDNAIEYVAYEKQVMYRGAVEAVVNTDVSKQEKLFYIQEIPLDKELQEYTYDLCLEKEIDYELALAVMWRESRFQIDATGYNKNGTQDSGIMQINDINKKWIADEISVTDLYDPQQNILAGLTILSEFIAEYGEHDGLMAYGTGEVGIKRLKAKGITTNRNVQLALDKRDEIELMQKCN